MPAVTAANGAGAVSVGLYRCFAFGVGGAKLVDILLHGDKPWHGNESANSRRACQKAQIMMAIIENQRVDLQGAFGFASAASPRSISKPPSRSGPSGGSVTIGQLRPDPFRKPDLSGVSPPG
jgi:hypothetical protein